MSNFRLAVQTSLLLVLISLSTQVSHAGPLALKYSTDFSADPGWVTNSPANLSWDSGSETYSATQININAGGNFAYHDVGAFSGSFRAEWDVSISSIAYASNLTFGIFDSDNNTLNNGSYATVFFVNADDGHYVIFRCKNSSDVQGYGTSLPARFSLNNWYRVIMEYDAVANTLTATITDRDTSAAFATMTIADAGPFSSDMTRLGTSNVRETTYQVPGAQTIGRFDNVKFLALPILVCVNCKSLQARR